MTFLERIKLAETEEKKIQKTLERGLPFKSIDYDYYMRAVRRFGYKGKMNPKVLPHVLKELLIHLPDENDKQSPYYRMMLGDSMLDCDGQFSAQRL